MKMSIAVFCGCLQNTIRPLVFLLLFCSGCSLHGVSRPNIAYQGHYPQCIFDIEKTNLLLFEEIGKLPEIQDGIQAIDEKALNTLCKVYFTEEAVFEKVFVDMYNTGIPNVRKYCTPLQALFWLAQAKDAHVL